ncbi:MULTISPECIES: ABC transporter substrate-binding protein [Arthrobacter]|uniref:ABC transporter substrate-binding protein n=1 Tax=Arthrobacter terricola TaxID=2547396 RepID=A0A4R5KEJ9_9MICC|nr:MULTISPECIES: ABC transporter substrate-binding protein [Arthrobacter]MBT8159715.1 ABC transporter substrate-binding protein [Arthrobacter sp. GN70]TDF93663.1 ABC transporter substrate-binding protein [Arthrobacter terricola]
MKFLTTTNPLLRAKVTVAAAMVGCVLATAACTGTTSSASNTAGGTLKVTAGASGPFTDNFNALIASSSSATGFAAYAIFEPLLQEDFGSGKTQPWLVTSYTWGPDGKTLTLKIKDGVKWSDGTAFTAKDVAFTFNLMKANPAFNAVSLPLTGAEATDDTTAVVHFSKPAYQVMWWRTETVPEHIWKDVQDPVKYANPNPVGTGPYMLKTFTPQAITLQKNPNYWQAGGNFPTVQYLAADSSSSMIANLQSGGVDWIGTAGIDGATVKKLAPNAIDYWNTTINPSVALLLPNFNHAPLDQLPVRKAMDMALDRDEISKIGTAGLNAPVESPTGMDVKTRSDLIASAFSGQKYGKADPEQAKKILTAAGYQLGSDNVFVSPTGQRLDFKLTVPTTYPQADLFGMTRVMVPELAAAGIKVTVKSEQQQAYVKDVEMGNYELTMRTNGGTPSVYDFYNRIINQQPIKASAATGTQLNYERYPNPDAPALLGAYAAAAPGSKQEQTAVGAIQNVMVNDLPGLPLVFSGGAGMWRTDRATGWPSASDPYAAPVPGSVNAELVLLKVSPK